MTNATRKFRFIVNHRPDVSAEAWATWCDTDDPRIDSQGSTSGYEPLTVYAATEDEARAYLESVVTPGATIEPADEP